jgi:glycosyltransferase involved in cell wall biosynthesis
LQDILTDEITYAFNTIEELELFYKIFKFIPKKNNIIGINISYNEEVSEFNRFNNINYKYFIYIGRIDEGKGILDLINNFKNWKTKYNSEVKLILAGTGLNKYSTDIDIIFTGFINEKEKQYLIQNSILVINPSPMESFSIVVMEAWMNEKAVLVKSKSETLKNHCHRSNAGLYFYDSESFEKTINFIYCNTSILQEMGSNGRRYVEINYSPAIILEKFNHLFSTHILSLQK